MHIGDGLRNVVEKFLREIRVYDCGLTKTRLGNKGDGGYVVAMEPLALANTLYSFGVGDNVSFELDFIHLFPKAKVKLFDPTITAPPVDHKQFEFYGKAIDASLPNGGVPDDVPVNSFLKMDVEWAEWEGILEVPLNRLRFSQMVIEFHILHVEPRASLSPYFHSLYRSMTDRQNTAVFNLYRNSLLWINTWYYCFHIHANNSLPVVEVGGFLFPPLLEMSFIRKDLVENVHLSTERFPVPGLDSPNKVDRQDFVDWYSVVGGSRAE